MRDVAAAVGVSMMTVSNVINGRHAQMRSDTRARVEDAIRRLNYRPHSEARSLRRAERLSIGMLMIDDSPTYLAHPGHSYVIAGLSSYLNERGYSLTLQGILAGEIRNALPLKRIGTDALCIVQCGPRARRLRTLDYVAELRQPCVLIHENRVPAHLDACCIREDDVGGGRMIARHVLDQGCRALVLLLPSTIWPSMEERARGVVEECRKRRASLTVIRCGSASVEATQAALAPHLAARMPDGIVAGHDQMGIAALKLLKARGVSVPRQVRVTGFNAFELWKYSDPLLTTIRAPAQGLGERAGEELIRRLTRGGFSARHIVLPVELVRGRST